MAKLTLKDVVRYSETMKAEDLIDNPDMRDYLTEMQEVGNEVLMNLSDEELAAAVSFMQSLFSMSLMRKEPMLALALLSKPKAMGVAMASALRVAVGIILSEEWR